MLFFSHFTHEERLGEGEEETCTAEGPSEGSSPRALAPETTAYRVLVDVGARQPGSGSNLGTTATSGSPGAHSITSPCSVSSSERRCYITVSGRKIL